ncbi:Alternative NAD(P)H-ubiquinone oxidoreductase C1, chloroplastic/mitochondrial [Vitis vinifera]|uniref:Alternative NAD(P)H-ubiquinone oxidoreductase C1, chloroplastic/mitochondrial n=1 Tax=Vitis vinifera TaxID=29760 RepID=A0A438KIP8_VITVI|nr:Alternative NAD(P)H-ubiquinone oxidoreductase C1, chloroplastic/mitochondrial [Vitis vinifera]
MPSTEAVEQKEPQSPNCCLAFRLSVSLGLFLLQNGTDGSLCVTNTHSLQYPSEQMSKTQNWDFLFSFAYSLSNQNSGAVDDMFKTQDSDFFSFLVFSEQPNRGVSGRSKQWGMLFPGSSRKLAINMSILMNFQSKGFSFVASGATQWNGGVAELVEGEAASRPYTWPDKKKPRVCILGGGFGGLYTALRLESLVWPEDKKPQGGAYLFQRVHVFYQLMNN